MFLRLLKHFIYIMMTCLSKYLVLTCILFCMMQSAVAGRSYNTDIHVSGNEITLIFDTADYKLVHTTVALLQKDITSVTGTQPRISSDIRCSGFAIIIGSTEKSALIRQLIQKKKINIDSIQHKWEAYLLQTVSNPFPGVEQALVITGNNRRGVAYGVFELSRQIGVSPWYWWADVPVKKQPAIYFKKKYFLADAPEVKYRGIFINDEAPALSGWVKEKYGDFNHRFYEKIFELILRQKGNYLWPAMWGHAFYDDDSLNIKAADDYAIVIGTSHHEPLMRAHDEWKRYGKGKWNYDSNETALKTFWTKGMQQATNEKIVSIGMRGDGDEPMTRETATALLERIVKDQRAIIEQVTHRPAGETPQLWALYKEVQDYYDKGMRVPDDVTLLLCDDNWGNIRRLPKLNEPSRKGGYGIYYHFDYVGDPRNYKWLNTNNIARTWEQMHLAYAYHAKQIWIVNVGDIKPMEYPISFFLDYAWNPERIDADSLPGYAKYWAAAQFGNDYAADIADILTKYSIYNARRKPELLNDSTYSLLHYKELQRVTDEWLTLLAKAEDINHKISVGYKNAYFQLVLHPVKACTNLQQLYHAVAWNRFFARQKNSKANRHADNAKQFYLQDSLITLQYHSIANGKWNHMMDQTHIGYTYWQQPEENSMPAVKYITSGSALPEATFITPAIPSAKELVPENNTGNLFYEQEGYVSIYAAHYTKAINGKEVYWKTIPGIGRDGDGITSFPVTVVPDAKALTLQYEFYTYDSGACYIHSAFSPTLNLQNTTGLRYAIAIDDEQPQVTAINKDDADKKIWESWVAGNIITQTTKHHLSKPGKHVIRYSVLDPAIVLQKLVVDLGGVKQSYLGPPETNIRQPN